jgi:chromatin remodeling complex protein RSC6
MAQKKTQKRGAAPAARKSGSGQQKKKTEKGGLLDPVIGAVRSHPVAAAAAVVAVGGAAIAGAARGRAAAPVEGSGAKKASAKVTPDAALGAVVGTGPMTRADITKRLWLYIRENNLQDDNNRRMINADARLRPIFQADQVSMFEMTRLVSGHVSAGG